MKRVDIISKVVGRDSSGKPVGGGVSVPMGNYALKSDFELLKSMFNDFLEGDDTDSVINRWKDLEAFLNGISEEDPLTSILGNYVPISGYTEILGEKNFVGGLKVNGSPIYYDKDKKYWKLEGDLLITGGLTMYGNDSDFVASTIMDAILYDDSTLGINAQGQLYVKGGTGGGTVSGDYLPLTGGTLTGSLEIKTNSSYVHFKGSNGVDRGSLGVLEDSNASVWKPSKGWKTILDIDNYSSYALPLSGGTLTGTLAIINEDVSLCLYRQQNNATPYIRFAKNATTQYGELGVYNDGRLVFWPLVSSQGGYGKWNTVWHSGNDGSGSGLDADLLDGLDATAFFCDKGASNSFDDKIYNGAYRTSSFKPNNAYGYGLVASFRSMETCAQIYFPDNNGEPQFRMQWNSQTGISRGWTGLVTAASIGNYNAGSATKLATPRTIWGQSFDGTGNVSGFLKNANFIMSNNNDGYFVGNRKDGVGSSDGGLLLFSYGNNPMSLFTNSVERIRITPTGDVGIGTTIPAYKLDIVGHCRSEFMYFFNKDWNGNAGYIGRGSNGNNRIILYAGSDDVYIYSKGVISTIFTGADMLVQGGVTMYSDQRKKTILNHVELSLQQVANAPLIEHYYNSDQNKTTHVGSIAQYWAEMNDWFCKKDSEGFYTMEIQNCALASAISVARELVKFETETDRRIRLLEEENKRLKEEVEYLKLNIA